MTINHDFKPHTKNRRTRHEIGRFIALASLAGMFIVFIWGDQL